MPAWYGWAAGASDRAWRFYKIAVALTFLAFFIAVAIILAVG